MARGHLPTGLFTLTWVLLLIMAAAPVPAALGAPARVPVTTVVLPLLVDGPDARLYALVLADGQEHHIGVFSATDGRSLASFAYSNPFALDAKGNRLFVISGPDQVAVLDSRSGKTLRTLDVKGVAPASRRPLPAPQFDVQTGHLLVFAGNRMKVLDSNTGQELASTSFDVPVQDRCRMASPGPLPIERTFFDAERRLVYLQFTSYACTPWVGFTVVAYDLAKGAETSRVGTDGFSGLAAGGNFYAEGWHRFGIGTIWTERDGKADYRSTGWSGGGAFQLDTKRARLYQSAEGSVRIFDPKDMRLLAVAAQPVKGELAAYDPTGDRLYFVDGGTIRPWPAARLVTSAKAPAPIKTLPAAPVNVVAPSPAWQQDNTLFASWSAPYPDTTCYVFNQVDSGPLAFTRDGGKQWLAAGSGLPALCARVSALAVSPAYAKDRTLLAGIRGNGIFRSTDGGTTWLPAGKGLPHMAVHDLALSPAFARDRTAFASVYENGLQRSVDGGVTWQTLPTSLAPVIALSPEFEQDGTVAVYGMKAGGGSVQLSNDRGEHWRELTAPSTGGPRLLSLAPGFSRWGVMFAGDVVGDLYRSADAGQTWQRVLQAGGDSANPGAAQMQIAYGPNEARREVYLVASGARYEGEQRSTWGHLYRSGDGGQTWAEMDAGTGAVPTALALSPTFAQDRLLFIGTGDGRIVQIAANVLE